LHPATTEPSTGRALTTLEISLTETKRTLLRPPTLDNRTQILSICIYDLFTNAFCVLNELRLLE